ncbi:hypothetical protein [Trichoplusia ni ascovirus 2c]|uniref:hypothetical protein n=1 Tax=Trichoplusia ni ascovirus 2c TaxID=328615 RepID=UPI0000E441E5|nr:hypothetical protein TNAV2c_gp013 [Trichoplusia ni ascovirus 2c]ABF70530.1 hypothetical protein [Trichoplusia ni ascovirus 2c]
MPVDEMLFVDEARLNRLVKNANFIKTNRKSTQKKNKYSKKMLYQFADFDQRVNEVKVSQIFDGSISLIHDLTNGFLAAGKTDNGSILLVADSEKRFSNKDTVTAIKSALANN